MNDNGKTHKAQFAKDFLETEEKEYLFYWTSGHGRPN